MGVKNINSSYNNYKEFMIEKYFEKLKLNLIKKLN